MATDDEFSCLQALLDLSTLMTDSGDERRILHLVSSAVPPLGGCRLGGVYLADGAWKEQLGEGAVPGESEDGAGVRRQLIAVGSDGGPLDVPGAAWGWAFPIRSQEETFGHLVAVADAPPSANQQLRLRVLTEHAGAALSRARAQRRERAAARALRAANNALEDTVASLQRSRSIHDRLTKVAVTEGGQEGIAQAVHELSGFPVAIEDRHGNLVAWAGPGRPRCWEKETPAQRTVTLDRLAGGRPVRRPGRLACLARPRPDLVAVIALVDPDERCGAGEQVALEHGATGLAIELTREHSVAEAELRLGRDLAEELLAGADEGVARAHARALGYDLFGQHRVAVVRPPNDGVDATAGFFHAVRRAARDAGVGSLQIARDGAVVVLCRAESEWPRFMEAIECEGSGGGSWLAVGGRCERPSDFPRSHREARLAQRLQLATGSGGDHVVVFDDLGLCRILLSIEETTGIEELVRESLGPLLDYDAARGSTMLATLGAYLECGGNYDGAAHALAIHRNTLKYRLKRISELSGHELSKPDVRFNLQLAIRAWQSLGALRSAPLT